MSMSEYYTWLKCVWEKLEEINELTNISSITDEITIFLEVLTKQREEQRLF